MVATNSVRNTEISVVPRQTPSTGAFQSQHYRGGRGRLPLKPENERSRGPEARADLCVRSLESPSWDGRLNCQKMTSKMPLPRTKVRDRVCEFLHLEVGRKDDSSRKITTMSLVESLGDSGQGASLQQ